jgi:hypothetical protein
MLRELRVDLSSPLESDTVERQPDVVEVWLFANQTNTVQFLHGTTKVDTQSLFWQCRDSEALLRTLLGQGGGGRVLLRVHCGHLFDRKMQPVSATLDVATALPNPAPTLGGVFEAWLFVSAG